MNFESIVSTTPQILQSVIYYLSSSLLYPVIIVLLGLTVWVVVEIGMFSFEWVSRSGRLKKGDITGKGVSVRFRKFLSFFSKKEPKDIEAGVVEAKMLIDNGQFEEGIGVLELCTSKRHVHLFLYALLELKEKEIGIQKLIGFPKIELFSINVEKLLQKCDILISKRIGRTKIMVRLGPMFGLMGTLIPMGPALRALSQGDITALTEKLIIAFGTTVIGLLIGSISYFITVTRVRWYEEDTNEINYICEVLFGGKDEIHEEKT